MEEKKKRIEYIDALRGLAILLVVIGHVSYFCLKSFNMGTLSDLIYIFHMPLFFCISGFVLYKKDFINNIFSFLSFMRNKTLMLLIPTILFFILYCITIKNSVYIELKCYLLMPYKAGYWFTFTLWSFCLVYSIFTYCMKKMGIRDAILLLMGLSILLFGVYYSHLFNMGNSEIERYMSAICFYIYFQYFVFGLLLRKFYSSFKRIIENKLAFFIIQIFIVLLFILKYSINSCSYINIKILYFSINSILAYLCIVFMFALFRRYQYVFSMQHKIGVVLQYMGKRTLDIYLIHYFFLFSCPWVADFVLSCKPIFVPELVCNLIITSIVVGCTLCTSYLLRSSSITKYYLFGRR